MEEQANSLEALFEKTSDYLETRIELLKLQAVDKTSDITSSLLSRVIIALIISLVVLILNVGIAIWIGDMLGKIYYGFFLVSAFYIVVAMVFYSFRSKWIKEPFSDKLVKKMLN